MEKGSKRIIAGIILIVLQVMSRIGNMKFNQGFERTPSMATLHLDIAYFLGSNFIGIIGIILIISAIISRKKEKRQWQAAEQSAETKLTFAGYVASDAASTIIEFILSSNKIPSDGAIITRLKELTSWTDIDALRRLASYWLRANDKMKELKKELVALHSTSGDEQEIKDLAYAVAKNLALFLCEFNPNYTKNDVKMAVALLNSFLLENENMYK